MPNHLKNETSPYLLQHADNPVNWYAWGGAAFEVAVNENKPVLLSIGYSACHWCHVMAYESFEDPATARLMNKLFVNIKVDREERPDIDRIYQLAHQLLSQRPGGWPLTVFLSPRERMPFFAGTYFPPAPRHGMPAFSDVLQQLAAFYHDHPQDLVRQREALADVYRRIEAGGEEDPSPLDRQPIEQAAQLLSSDFDSRNGGFNGAPKFPQPGALALLLRAGLRGNQAAERKALYTLERMRLGGLYDQLGGGFFRYCVDAAWQIPHFEKMLYDNATLLPLYAQAAAGSGQVLYRSAVLQTANWLARDMQLPGGAWAASLDADNPQGEGAYYAWSREAIQQLLSDDQFQLVEKAYGLDQPPNFEGQWHLTRQADGAEPADTQNRQLDQAQQTLLNARQQRTPPGRDDKVLTAWNALMIHGLSRAGLLLNEPALLQQAQTALAFIDSQCWQNDRLYAVWTDKKVRQPAFLDDTVFLLQAHLTVLQVNWNRHGLHRACTLADNLINQFEDKINGGFFFTARDSKETLIHRPKSFTDESLPSGNAIAAAALLRLGWLLGKTHYLDAAERTLRAGQATLQRAPHAHCYLLNALDDYLDPPPQIILRGTAAAMHTWRQQLPPVHRADVYAIPADEEDLPDALQAHKPQGDCVAYVCRGTQCEAPVMTVNELTEQLKSSL